VAWKRWENPTVTARRRSDHWPTVPRVLIIDDDAGFLRTASRLLGARGLDVVGSAETGAAGLEAVAELEPDGVLLDVHLPGADGYSVARAVAARHPSVRILLTSSDSDAGQPVERELQRTCTFVAKSDLVRADLRALLG
jgi:DNA-binding NarL/FixJ family response regulator